MADFDDRESEGWERGVKLPGQKEFNWGFEDEGSELPPSSSEDSSDVASESTSDMTSEVTPDVNIVDAPVEVEVPVESASANIEVAERSEVTDEPVSEKKSKKKKKDKEKSRKADRKKADAKKADGKKADREEKSKKKKDKRRDRTEETDESPVIELPSVEVPPEPIVEPEIPVPVVVARGKGAASKTRAVASRTSRNRRTSSIESSSQPLSAEIPNDASVVAEFGVPAADVTVAAANSDTESEQLTPEVPVEPVADAQPAVFAEPAVPAEPVEPAAPAVVKKKAPAKTSSVRTPIEPPKAAQETPVDLIENPERDYSESMEYLNLKWGAKLPKVGFGFWKVDKAKTAAVCREAIEVGYRHLDCACDYGNEAEVGQGIRSAVKAGIIEREDLWITSKLWNTYHAPEHVKPALERSLSDLGLEYIDLYLIHFPLATKFVPFEKRYPPGWFTDPNASRPLVEEVRVPIRETWQAMEELAKIGLIKQIGVCNFGTAMLRELLAYCHIRPTVLQVETHPYLTQPKLLRYCQQERIAYTAFSPLGAQSYYSLGMADPSESVLSHPVIAEISRSHRKTPAQIVLRWGVQRGTAVIPKTSTRERIKENINIFDFELTAEEMKSIDSLDQGRRFNDPGHFGEVAFNTFLPIYE